MSHRPGLTRRGFLGATAAASTGVLAAGCRPAVLDPPPLSAPAGPEDQAWAHVRPHFLLPEDLAYLNNASLGMPPASVVDAVAQGYRAISEEPLHGKHALQERIATEVVPGLARLLGARPGELVLTRNASEALHLQTVGLDLRPGDEVIITAQEHPAGRRPWEFRAGRDDIRVTEVFIPSPLTSSADVLERMAAAVSPRTRALAFCHVTRGGHRYPVAELCRFARDRGLVSLVDGAQAVGQFPVNLGALGCDAYSASLHKWMLGPSGTGLLYVREGARAQIRTEFAPDATLEAPQLGPPGTMDFPVRAALADAITFVETLGLHRIEGRCRHLSDYLKDRLSTVDGVRLLSGTEETSAPGSTIFEKDGLDAVEAVGALEIQARAHIDEHQRDGHDAIRVSTHVYNTRAEIDRLVDALRSGVVGAA